MPDKIVEEAMRRLDRQKGYYWVKPKNLEWTVSKYMNGYWFIVGQLYQYGDNTFTEINETRILSPDEQLK